MILSFPSLCSIKDVKEKIKEKEGIPSERQRLMLTGREVPTRKILRSNDSGSLFYLLEAECELLHVILKMDSSTFLLKLETSDNANEIRSEILQRDQQLQDRELTFYIAGERVDDTRLMKPIRNKPHHLLTVCKNTVISAGIKCSFLYSKSLQNDKSS